MTVHLPENIPHLQLHLEMYHLDALESYFQPAYAHMRVNRMLECGVITKTLYNQVGY